MGDSLALLVIGTPFAVIGAAFSWWWTGFMIRAYRRSTQNSAAADRRRKP